MLHKLIPVYCGDLSPYAVSHHSMLCLNWARFIKQLNCFPYIGSMSYFLHNPPPGVVQDLMALL